MATFLKRGDKWQAQTCIRGRRKAKTFDTKAEARALGVGSGSRRQIRIYP